jgi:hypothetical protein
MTEFDLQRAVCQFLMLAVPSSEMTWRAVPNGEYRSKRTAGKLKAAGVRAGVADFHCTLRGGRTLWIELKTRDGRLSPAQKDFRREEEAIGAAYEVVRTLDELQDTLRRHGVIVRARAA